ncbi:LysR family transcriptional regulator [Candidimonas sp. SYP-B2681]|uniref:LysR family transcriptional regulator n=1 Tax=Candidimonas sp. SYP-B2681 TaxID=2497686 RepID=UPI000F865F0E|nr:LysR family transcriptional regulator [Candidimonas sp. SYP-B2681]RTZ41595.1 LysR family transcriptional regulator [Candidimonas sp. SYP-B2681]
MDTRFIESFVQVVELGSIAAAARFLDLTPTAVSLRLKALEAEVGTTLIERSGRTVKPTQAGSKVLKQARLILVEVKNFSSLASNNELPAGPLTLGATPSALKGMLPPVLRKWVDTYENIDVLIEPAASTVLYDGVLRGDLDAAILVHPLFDMPKTLHWRTLRTERLVLLTPVGMEGRDPFAIINENPFIRYDRRVVAGKMADDYLTSHNVHPNARLELDGIDYIADLVKSGLGVSVLPDWASGDQIEPALTRHSLPEPVPTRSLGLLWLRANPREKLVRAFLDLAIP